MAVNFRALLRAPLPLQPFGAVVLANARCVPRVLPRRATEVRSGRQRGLKPREGVVRLKFLT